MTKVREPVSIENTLLKVLGELTIEAAAEATTRSAGYLHALTDPAKEDRQLTTADARKLDLAWRASGRPGFPLLEAQTRLLEAEATERFAEAAELSFLTLDYAREAGQATAALIAAQMPGASLAVLETALRECEEADERCSPVIAHLRERIRRARDGPPDTS